MHFALMLMLALAQSHGQFGKDTKGADATTHDKEGVAEPEGRGKQNPPPATASNTSDKAESLSPVHQTELQGGDSTTAKKSPAKSAKKAKKSAKSMPEATPPSTPGNGMERDDTAKPAKKTPSHKEPNIRNEDQNPDNKSPNGQH
ncbi:MAG: hypothetical protein ACJ784_23375 [Myxococcales bacterium]